VAQYFGTVLGAMAVLALGATVIWIAIVEIMPMSAWKDPRVVSLLRLTAVLVFIRIFESAFVNLLRAEQLSGWYSTYQVIRKYAGLAIILVTVFYVVHGLHGFYVGSIAAESTVVLGLGLVYLHRRPISLSGFQPGLFKAMLQFGLPMIGYEIGGVVLSVGDRYVLQALAGPEKLGYYSASYNMCEYVQTILLVSIGQAVTPMYTRIWEEKGADETIAFISRVLHFYLMLGTFVVAALAAVGHDVLAILASEKYRPGGVIIPWVIAGMVLEAGLPIVAAGIFIKKQTHTIMALVLASAVINIALNFLLVPRFGIMGSAFATLVSYMLLTGSAMVVAHKRLAVPFPVTSLLKFSVLAALSYFAMSRVSLGTHVFIEMLLKGIVGAVCFVALILVFDAQARQALQLVRGRFGKVASA